MADGMATRPEAPRRSLARTPTQVQVQVPAQAQAQAQMPSQTRAPVQARAPAQARAREQVQVPAQARARARVQMQVQVPAKHPERCNPRERTSSRRAIQKSERRPYPRRPTRLRSAQPNSQQHDA